MSWFARSIANSLNFDDDDDGDGDGDGDGANADQKSGYKQPENPESPNAEVSSPTRGVKEDLSELSKTVTRQLWGVASFLAPPPQSEVKSEQNSSGNEQDSMLGIRNDFAEIGGRFRSGISRLSSNINVSEITKMASNLLQLESDGENEEAEKGIGLDSMGKGAGGVTEEVVAFARDISMHPETWLDFPLQENVGDDADFDMSDAQQEHALAVEQLAPGLTALRIGLCPRYLSESSFWKIYFVLLHPRLDKHDAELLSTPQIAEASSLLVRELKIRNTAEQEDLSGKISSDKQETKSLHVTPPSLSREGHGNASESENDSVDISEIQIEDKSVILENSKLSDFEEKDEDDADDWLKEETGGATAGKTILVEIDDDVSFSDLEEVEDDDAPTSSQKSNCSSDKDSRDWVQL